MGLFNPKTLDAADDAFAFAPSEAQLTSARHWANLLREGLFVGVKETALEADFNRYVVQDVLGYRSINPGGEATVAVKERIGAGEVDLALGSFSVARRHILAPFELKGPDLKNLDAIMPGRAKTPVQQAWEYANDAVGAKWVLVSNMVEVRLYRLGQGRQNYETFDLRRLDEPSALKRFCMLLAAERLLGGETDTLLQRSLTEDKDVTDQLYLDYRTLRDTLLDFIRTRHMEIAPEDAIRLAQKILDRVLFIAFAEDTVLLPDDSLRKAVTFEDPYDPQPRWKYLKQLFQAVDRGNHRLDIPAYNGGLFAPDLVLDGLDVPDLLVEQFAVLSGYDFKSQVSVTILGHIFEQSISDIERELALARGEEPPTTTTRKRFGVVYTPEFVTRFLVERTLGTHMDECSRDLLATHATGVVGDGAIRWRRGGELAYWRGYFERLTSLRIVDPACGSGAFLIAAFDWLKAEHERVRERLSELEPGLLVHSSADADIEIITRNLYGVDVNAESVEITKLALWLKTARRGRQLESLDHTIRRGNSLIEDSDFHQRAFVWRDAFPEVFKEGGFDVVLGNPPYVRMELLKPIKPYLAKRYEVVADRADLYAYFFELGVRILRSGGRLGYISSSTFFRTRAGEPLRRYLTHAAEIETVVDFGDVQVFQGVTTYPAIVTLRRLNGHATDTLAFLNQKDVVPEDLGKLFDVQAQTMPRSRLGAGSWRFESDHLDNLRKKMAAGRATLKDVYGPPLRGIVTGLNEAFVVSRGRRDELVAIDPHSAELLKPFLVGENLKRWLVESDDLWLIYTPKKRVNIESYPAIRNHLAPFRERLEKRATQQEWWELQQAQAGYEADFLSPKVIYPHFNDRSNFSYDPAGIFYSNDKSYVIPTDNEGITAYLNSKALWFFLMGLSPAVRGGFYEARVHYVAALPVDSTEGSSVLNDRASAARIAAATKRNTIVHALARFQDLARGRVFAGRRWEAWYLLTFAEFRELVRKMAKEDIPVAERDEWEAYFNARKAEVQALDARIADLETEINERVYHAFGLTPDEIALIDEALQGQH